MADNFGNGLSNFFPLYLKAENSPATLFGKATIQSAPTPNLSKPLRAYLESLKVDPPEIFLHCVAVLQAPSYRSENAGALRIDWPRIPLPAFKEPLLGSAKLGRSVAALLDIDVPVEGVTVKKLRPELSPIGSISRLGGGSLDPDVGELDVRAGWGHRGKDGAVMPGKGKVVEREYTAEERKVIAASGPALGVPEEQVFKLLGTRTLDVYLNNLAYWRNIPIGVWEYTIGGSRIVKKWLSYREREILGRALKMDEARAVTDIARRIAAILLMEPELDANYEAVKKTTYSWNASS